MGQFVIDWPSMRKQRKRQLADRPEDLAADLVVIGLPSKRRRVATETG